MGCWIISTQWKLLASSYPLYFLLSICLFPCLVFTLNFLFKLFPFFIMQYLQTTTGLCWKASVQKRVVCAGSILVKTSFKSVPYGIFIVFQQLTWLFAHLGFLFLFLIFLTAELIEKNSYRVTSISPNSWLYVCQVTSWGAAASPSPQHHHCNGFLRLWKILAESFWKAALWNFTSHPAWPQDLF